MMQHHHGRRYPHDAEKVRLANELSPNRLYASRQEVVCSIFTVVLREEQIKAWKVEEQHKYCN